MEVHDQHIVEVNRLRWKSYVTVTALVAFIVASIGVAVYLLSLPPRSATKLESILLGVVTGVLGSSVAALRSSVERLANGWETKDSTKYPEQWPKDKFGARLIPGFLARPFMGAGVGLLVYLGVISGLLIAAKGVGGNTLSSPGLAFLCFIGGLFAKTLLEKLFKEVA